ncbi:ATP-binding protein [Rhizobium ruizarguesonis]
MSILAQTLSRVIRARLFDEAMSKNAAEVRLIFHGPPIEILSDVFDQLVAEENREPYGIPVVLQVPTLAPGETNPAIGASGRCNEDHVLNLRNSPSAPAYVALIGPGQHSNRSVTSSAETFGVSDAANGGNVQFEDWWKDDFVQFLAQGGVEALGTSAELRDEAVAVVGRAAYSADEVDNDRKQRPAAWRVLSRLFSAQALVGSMASGSLVSLVSGMPPLKNGQVSSREQASVLAKIADALAVGFGTGIARLQESDAATEADVQLLTDFLDHIRNSCDLPSAFERATAAFYAPHDGFTVYEPPTWWSGLTVEKWLELLTEEAPAVGNIQLTCKNALIPMARGIPVLVAGEVALALETAGTTAGGTVVTIERSPAGPTGRGVGQVSTSGEELIDAFPPEHRNPMRYVGAAEGFKPGAIKVISLATWAPGIFIACRAARKLTAPRKPRKTRGGPDFETSLTVAGAGRYELLVFTSPGVEVEDASGAADDGMDSLDSKRPLTVTPVPAGHYRIEVEVEGNYEVEIKFSRATERKKASIETCVLSIAVEDVAELGCKSEFERLIRVNRRVLEPSEAKLVVQLNRSPRSSTLQEWMLNSASSYKPIVIADDYAEKWAEPNWDEPLGAIFSSGSFLKDPRPAPDEFLPPPGFLEARQAIVAEIKGEDHSGLAESALFGSWIATSETFKSVVEAYIDSYHAWLASDPDVACWVDVVVVASLEPDGRTLSRIPDAILLSPLHPLRLSWHAVAQHAMIEASDEGNPCPAASILDPDCVPDIMSLSLRAPGGIEPVNFVAVENGTDYWSVLWNGNKLGRLPERSQVAPFGEVFGISVGGISGGFSAAQVARALDDVSDLLAAKPVIGVAVSSAGGATDACNDGLVSWSAQRYQEGVRRAGTQSAGPRFLEIYDGRDSNARPDEATIANLSEDTGGKVRWFNRQPVGAVPDLGIIAQLDMSEPGIAIADNKSPIGQGGLLRHRIRRQLPGAFLSESRQAAVAPQSLDILSDKVAACLASLENLRDERVGLRFAPNVNAVRDMLETKRTDFVAISSAAIDPAVFLGGWLEGAYLWDYDLPSYSHRAGDTNGYYLLSRVKEADRESLGTALSKLPGCAKLGGDEITSVLLEIARRGIPTIRGLAGDDSGATGDLGLFVAVRLLQDRFRLPNLGESLLPVISGTEDDALVSLIVPVDPFRGYLSDLTRSLRKDRRDITLMRPDLMSIGIRLSGGRVAIHLTPIEVKCRPGTVFPTGEIADALNQAKALSSLLSGMLWKEGQPKLWSLGFQHLLLSFIGFGMRVYSQHSDVLGLEARWAGFHERIAAAILGTNDSVTIDDRGRLIIIDDSVRSAPRDNDGDGFDETITIGRDDAGLIVTGNPFAFYDGVRAQVGDWGMMPSVVAPPEDIRPIQAVPTPTIVETLESPVETVELRLEPERQPRPKPEDATVMSTIPQEPEEGGSGVVLSIGTTVDGFQKRPLTLNLSDTRLNQLNIGVVGDLGTGKTQLLKSLITQITLSAGENRGIRPRFLIFDYKRDYSSADFVEATGARVVKPNRLPLNLFDTSGMGDTAAPWLDRFRFFSDVLSKIYAGIGTTQRENLKRAVKASYEASGTGLPPTLYDVYRTYGELVDGKVDSPMAIIGDLVDMEVFAPDARDTQPFNEFLDGVVVVSLDALGQDDYSKNMLVAVMLNMFYENMLRTPKRPFLGTNPQLRAIDSYLLVDEADNIMKYEFDVLRKLLLQGREFGAGVILASQYLRHFKVNATDYREPLLTWFVHKVPNVTPAELSKLGLSMAAADVAERVKALENHQCLFKSHDTPGDIIRGLPFFELMEEKRGRNRG